MKAACRFPPTYSGSFFPSGNPESSVSRGWRVQKALRTSSVSGAAFRTFNHSWCGSAWIPGSTPETFRSYLKTHWSPVNFYFVKMKSQLQKFQIYWKFIFSMVYAKNRFRIVYYLHRNVETPPCQGPFFFLKNNIITYNWLNIKLLIYFLNIKFQWFTKRCTFKLKSLKFEFKN